MLHCLNDRGGNSTMQAQVPKQDAKVQHESAISCHFLKKMHFLRIYLFGWNLCLTFLVCRRGIGEKIGK